MDQNMGTTIWIYTAFAGLIAIGVVYNSVRISFAERQRELASLRVLGFSRGEVSYILLGEIAFLTLLALPVGAGLGTLLAWFLSQAMSSDLFRLPFVINAATYGYAGLVVIVVTAVSGLLVRRQLDRMDLVSVLKSRD
jgi:putative ABC transport system permease protein